VAARRDPKLDDPPGSGDHHQEDAEYGGKQERYPERQVPVSAEVTDGHALAFSRMKISSKSRITAKSPAATQMVPMRVRLTAW
jgi:hypothetical protein